MAGEPEQYRGILAGRALFLTKNRALADDLVQDAMLAYYLKPPVYQGEAQLRGWLFTVMHNLYEDWKKARKRVEEVPLSDDVPYEGLKPFLAFDHDDRLAACQACWEVPCKCWT